MTMLEDSPARQPTAARKTLDRLVTAQPEPSSEIVRQKRSQQLSGVNPWKEAVIEALIVNCSLKKEHEHDPKQALLDLLKIETDMALDPVISSRAAQLLAKVPLMRFPTMLRKMWGAGEVQKWLDDRAAVTPLTHVGEKTLAEQWEKCTGDSPCEDIKKALQFGHQISSMHWQRSFADHVYVPCDEYAALQGELSSFRDMARNPKASALLGEIDRAYELLIEDTEAGVAEAMLMAENMREHGTIDKPPTVTYEAKGASRISSAPFSDHEREAFEREVINSCPGTDLQRRSDGDYQNFYVQCAWGGWHARANAPIIDPVDHCPFERNQWWMIELQNMPSRGQITRDQYRAVQVALKLANVAIPEGQ